MRHRLNHERCGANFDVEIWRIVGWAFFLLTQSLSIQILWKRGT